MGPRRFLAADANVCDGVLPLPDIPLTGFREDAGKDVPKIGAGIPREARSQLLEALRSIDLTRVALVSAEERMVRDTTITMSRQLHKRLKNIADDRDTSMNILVNTALARWLASKGALRVG